MGTLKVDKIVSTTGNATSAPITLSGDTATLGTGVTLDSGITGIPAAGITGTLGSGVVFPAGHPLQTKGAFYNKEGSLSVTSSSERLLSTNLEVEITCKSTSNYLRCSAYLPNYKRTGSSQSLRVGFRYSTDSWSSSDVDLGLEYIDSAIGIQAGSEGYHTDHGIFIDTWVQVPTTSPIKIQVATKAEANTLLLSANASASLQTYSLIVQEIQT